MKIRVATFLVAVVSGVFLLALIWEFVLEDLVFTNVTEGHESESDGERWEFIITSTTFAAIALLLPGALLYRASDRLTRLNQDLEQRVERQVSERLAIERTLGSETAGRRQAETLNSRLDRIIENSLNEVYVFDAQTLRFIQVNRRGRENLGRSMAQLARLSCADLAPYLSWGDLERRLEPLRNGHVGQVVFETSHRRKDGSQYDVEVRTQYMPQENPPLFVAFIQDITERKHIERDLVAAHENAEVANRAKSRFLAQMSHEMRTPLNGILGSTEMLLTTRLDQRQQEFVQKARQSAELMLDMISALLDQSRIEAGALRSESTTFDLRNAVGDVIGQVAAQAAGKGLTLTTEIADEVPNDVYGDLRHFRQVLSNLVGNAVKFTTEGTIKVQCTAAECTPDRFSLRTVVSDTGIGITPEMQPHIFQPFVQADGSTTRGDEGAGLGLAIAQQLVELMNGEIGVESDLGKGASFSFTIPLARPRVVADTKTLARDGDEKPLTHGRFAGRILLAEDNPVNAFAAKEMLRHLGCEVSVATNGKEAVAAFARENFDLVLMDCWMPEMDGFDAVARIRDHERDLKRSARTPVIACTAHVMQEDHQQCLTAGMDDCLTKPLTLARLSGVLQRWLADPAKPSVS